MAGKKHRLLDAVGGMSVFGQARVSMHLGGRPESRRGGDGRLYLRVKSRVRPIGAICVERTTVKGIAYNAYEVGRRACVLEALGAYREYYARAIFGRENRVVGACQRACGACTDSSKIAGRRRTLKERALAASFAAFPGMGVLYSALGMLRTVPATVLTSAARYSAAW